MTGYVQSLTEVNVNLEEVVYSKQEELNESNFPHYETSFDWEQLETELANITPYQVSEFWYRRFAGGGFYMGIMSYDPWWILVEGDKYSDILEEEDVWGIIMAYHIEVDGHSLKFRWDEKSPLNGWLRTHSRDGDTPINVETLMTVVFKAVMDKDSKQRDSDLWEFVELGWCKACEFITYGDPDNRWEWVCPECGTELEVEQACPVG